MAGFGRRVVDRGYQAVLIGLTGNEHYLFQQSTGD